MSDSDVREPAFVGNCLTPAKLFCGQPTLIVLNIVYSISNSIGAIYYKIVLHLTDGVKGRPSVEDYGQCQRMPDLLVCLEEMSINMANSLKGTYFFSILLPADLISNTVPGSLYFGT